ncbi:HAD family hydrolase [Micromonospora sp. M12]
MLLTGDNATAAARIAADTGIGEFHAELLPEQKVDHVRAQATAGHRLLLIGDGVHDAPALAAAHTGIAMGRSGRPERRHRRRRHRPRRPDHHPHGDRPLRRARRLVTANLIIAATSIVVLAGWDLLGHLPLPLGVAGHEGSTVIVGLDGLRLLRNAAWRPARPH